MIIANRYELISDIYKTPTTEIWNAIDNRNGEQNVSIKILKINDSSDQLLIKELFKREADSLSRIKHENIITYIDSGIDNGNFYIVTEGFEGENLYSYIQENPDLPYEKKLKIILDILAGLAEAHKNKIVHRDLKPTNILIDLFDGVKIIDFGISKILGVTYKSNQTLKNMMTVTYASPEQLLRGNISYTSDYYSVGCLIYFLFTNQDPVEDKSLLLQQIRNINCSDNMMGLLHKLLQLEQDKRPESIYEIISIIRTEYIELITKNTKLYVKIRSQIPSELHSLGKLRQVSIDGAISFIANDLENSVIYKNNTSYYLIGDSLKYHCKLAPDKNCMVIGNVNSLEDDYYVKESELRRGFKVYAKWIVVKHNRLPEKSEELYQILMQLNDEERRRKVRALREKKDNKLLQKWDEYLQEENLIIQQKKRLCNYTELQYDDMSGKLYVTIDQKEVDLEKNDLIQLTLKSDLTQTTVGVLDSIEGEKLTINLKPNINLEEISRRGKLGLDLIQAETSLKRLRKATRAIIDGSTINPNLMEIISDPELATMNTVINREDFEQPLDNSNKVAVNKALATKDIFLIQGPPGTGKTTVITEIVCKILMENPEARILLASQSHVAVDHALLNIAKYIGDKKAVRIGRLEKIAEESESLLMTNQVNDWVTQVRKQSKNYFYEYLKNNYSLPEDELTKKMNEIEDFNKKADSDINDRFYIDANSKKLALLTNITKEWNRRLGNLDEFDEIFAQNASIVAATCLGIASRHLLNEMAFDWVIVDEAARATAPELLVPLVRGKKIILVGDHKQLPPVVNSNIDQFRKEEKVLRKSDLEKSLFEDLFEKISEEAKIVLTSQFRMHPKIGQLINNVFYPTENITSKKTADERKHFMSWWPRTVIWLNTQNLPNSAEQEVGLSKRNETEAKIISKVLTEIEKTYSDSGKTASVAIISGYDAQRSVLTNLIQPNDSRKWKSLKLLINNVDAFQGSETDIAIYSLVRNNSKGKIGFLDDARRLNVALSRGKTCLIIVGNAYFAERAKVIGQNPFVEILSFIRNNPKDCLVEDIN